MFALPAPSVQAFPRQDAAQAADTTEHTLKRTFKKGDIDRYKLVFEAMVPSPTGSGETKIFLTMVIKETTKEIKPDGTIVLSNTADSANLKLGDIDQDITPMMPGVTQIRDKQGRLTEVKVDNAESSPLAPMMGGFMQMVLGAQAAFYPSKPVKVGDTWKIEPGPQPREKNVTSDGKATLVSKESVDKVETFKVKIIQDTQVAGKDPKKIHFEGTGNVEPVAGKLLRVTAQIEGDMEQFKKANFTITRVTGEEKAAAKSAGTQKP
jgi:hypothetical protein